VRFGTELLGDAHPEWEPVDPPGAVVAGDPGTWWAGLVRPASERVRAADLSRVVDSPMGRRTVAEGLRFPALDLFVHGWDLTRVVGADVEIPAGLRLTAPASRSWGPETGARRGRRFSCGATPERARRPAPPRPVPAG